jgi:hypothetical protein
MIQSALVIRKRWLDLILAGEKTWEMRSKRTQKRGKIGLIEQGSGLVVGTATLVDSPDPLSETNYAECYEKHRIPKAELADALDSGWVFPWVLADAKALPEPVKYTHKPGAVIFVNLDDKLVADNIARQLGATIAATKQPTNNDKRRDTVSLRPGQPEDANAHSDLSADRYRFAPEKAQAFGHETTNGFVVLKGSTAMRNGSPVVKRDRATRDKLLRAGILVPDLNTELLRFTADHEFSSPSQAAGVVKDGNASGPKLWLNVSTKRPLSDARKGG